ncbi:uncharacterized protein BJ171DRAFT_525832, partial [Polychytrium aggregatum]|uniref:uncharacterized protein n=1 Tax=Polychytrium aggregatum TaxID=110093 RepID=UPI0022FEDBC5
MAVIALCCVCSSLLTTGGGFGLYQYNKTHSTTPWSCVYVPTIKMYTVARINQNNAECMYNTGGNGCYYFPVNPGAATGDGS